MDIPNYFANRYVIMKDSAREGGTATVYKAIDSETPDIHVAVKVFKNTAVEDAFLQQMFYNEVESLSRLKHTNIVQLLDSGIDTVTNCYYVVLEWVEFSLTQWREVYRGDLDWFHLASQVILPVLDALALAHARGVRHRDIKPTNILLTPDGTPKVADFGLAKIVDSLQCGVTVNQFGARPYMPPEYRRAEVPIATPEGDIYSLGITILKALESPEFPIGPDFMPYTVPFKTAVKHLNLDPQTITFLIKLVHKEVTQRYFNAEVAREELKSLLKAHLVEETKHLIFYVSLTNSTREQMRVSHTLRTDHDIQEFFQVDISNSASIRLDTRSSLVAPAFDLFGEELLYRLQVPAGEAHKFLITSAKPVSSPDAFIKSRDRAMPISARWSFATPHNKTVATQDIASLYQQAYAHNENWQREKVDAEQREMYAKWRNCIKAKREVITGDSYGFTYVSWTRSGSQVIFEIK